MLASDAMPFEGMTCFSCMLLGHVLKISARTCSFMRSGWSGLLEKVERKRGMLIIQGDSHC